MTDLSLKAKIEKLPRKQASIYETCHRDLGYGLSEGGMSVRQAEVVEWSDLAALLTSVEPAAPKDEYGQGTARWLSGERVNVSTGIDGGLTLGYGDLSDNGYWEQPVHPRLGLLLEWQVQSHRPVTAIDPSSETKKENAMDDLKYLDPIENPPAGVRYHWRDNWFFQRTKLGAVLVTLPDSSQKVIPPNEWASIVASVCARGETGETFEAARAFHGEPDGAA